MGAVRMRVQIADKNITLIHKMTLVHPFTSSGIFVKKKSIIIHNEASSSENVHPLLSSHIKIHQHIWLELFLLSWFRRDDFFTEDGLKLNLLQTHSCPLHKLLDGLDLCELLEDYCDVLISCLDSHSDGTHSLRRIHWWASDVMLHFSKSVLMKKQTHLLILRDSIFSANFQFWVNYYFKTNLRRFAGLTWFKLVFQLGQAAAAGQPFGLPVWPYKCPSKTAKQTSFFFLFFLSRDINNIILNHTKYFFITYTMWSRTADVDRYSMGVLYTAIVIPQNSSEVVVASCEQRLWWEHSTYGNAICSMKGTSIFWEKLFCREIYAFD